MASTLPSTIDPTAPIFPIRVAARLAGMHPQTLRQYDRLELVVPARTGGGGRRYSAANIARLRMIQELSQEEGINLLGIRRILALHGELMRAERQLEELREVIDALRSQQPRVFTADAVGKVAHGRRLSRQLPALGR